MHLEKYGYHPAPLPENTEGIPARVTAVHRERFEMICDKGAALAHLKAVTYYAGGESFPTTGDFVLLDWQAEGESRILKTLPRRTFFSRLDPSSSGCGEQAIAANFDYVFILQAFGHDFNARRLERYLTLAWQSGATPVVVLTKADTIADAAAHVRLAQETAIGAEVIAVSAKSGAGLARLERYLQPRKTAVFLGSSGVGKSSLINVLAGRDVMATSGIREKDGRGRHTTSHRQLILLDSGVMVIDTPGMRELGMWDATAGLGQSFADVEQFLGQCKFRDCRHQSEPGCAVTAALRHGALSRERWESYQRLDAEARYAEDKEGYLRAKQQWHKGISKLIRQQQKAPDYRHSSCTTSFICTVCGATCAAEEAGSRHRNHCPKCLSSLHVDNRPGDRASLCGGVMDPISVWARDGGEWAVIHRCRTCGVLSSNRIAADDDPALLRVIAAKPQETPPFPQ